MEPNFRTMTVTDKNADRPWTKLQENLGSHLHRREPGEPFALRKNLFRGKCPKRPRAKLGHLNKTVGTIEEEEDTHQYMASVPMTRQHQLTDVLSEVGGIYCGFTPVITPAMLCALINTLSENRA